MSGNGTGLDVVVFAAEAEKVASHA